VAVTAGGGGPRVLVVEDEALIAMDIDATLRAAGFAVVGPLPRLAQAVRAAEAEDGLDAAVLDVNFGGELVFPAADTLASRGVPLVFLTGYGREILPERFRDRPAARKPYSARVLLALLSRALGR
jgi:DNA-binding response OmpR family regulator